MATAAEKVSKMFPRLEDVPKDQLWSNDGPFMDGTLYLVNGEVKRWAGKTSKIFSPICISKGEGQAPERVFLGEAAELDTAEAMKVLDAAVNAYDHGKGVWPRMKTYDRIKCMQKFVVGMKKVREQSVRLLMWEIAKTRGDAEKEFDRTVQYIEDTISELRESDRRESRLQENGGILAQIRRSPLGVVLCMGPFNYPLNETFTTLIPAVIMGNTVIAKLPRFGCLCQAPLLQAFAEAFPPGVVNIINGRGRECSSPIIQSGKIASLAFIGTSRVANGLKQEHPKPNRLRCILGLEAKNPAFILPDADLDVAVNETILGALSFNGQRCTGIKLVFVHRSIAETFVKKFADAVDALPFGMPWEKGVRLTPLPEVDKPQTLKKFVDDAVARGASVVNKNGGLTNGTFYFPSVVYPVDKTMTIFNEEQFGPVIPVAIYDTNEELMSFVAESEYGQQASVFGRDAATVGTLVDILANQVCRINLNAQCQRGPDVFPFTGRKDSAEGTLSVYDALRSFSIRSMVAVPETEMNRELLRETLVRRTSNFLNTDYIF
eukprot:TRINITY_DN6505_c0_g1_i1.p1 TRINITY_DN6505_c0_g1~~TRINITY_DN6505_c0_g1_i1.p1  ORF type:complete len:568 (-),score=124.42 TRINITY_DN6505_c0_g1_i1:1279-2922(-)